MSVLGSEGCTCLCSGARSEAPALLGSRVADMMGRMSAAGSAARGGGEAVLEGGVVRRNVKTSSAVACPSSLTSSCLRRPMHWSDHLEAENWRKLHDLSKLILRSNAALGSMVDASCSD